MLRGTRDPAQLAVFPFPEPLELDDTFVVQATWELAGTPGVAMVPPALHPTLPMLISVIAVRGHAQVRLSCRHGARARALVIGTSDDVDFDGERLTVGGGSIVVAFAAPTRHLGATDVQYVTSLWPVEMEGRGLRLVQQEIDVEVTGPTRHPVSVESWDPRWPVPAMLVGASVAPGSVSLPRPRFMARPDLLAFEGSETTR